MAAEAVGGAGRPITGAERRRAVVAATIGSALEWYDFIVYSFFAATIGRLFFPGHDPAFQLLAALATFGVGFFMRPLGAIVLGVYGDRAGRRAALSLTIFLMVIGMAIMTVAPTYAEIGITAPVLIVLARLVQGFSAGGEFGSTTAYLSEYALSGRRGYYVSWQQASQFAASLLGALIGSLVARSLAPDTLLAWGWRVPFAIGLLIGPIGLYIRHRLDETPAFAAGRPQRAASPLRTALAVHLRVVLGGFGLVIYGTASVYVLVLFLPTYAARQFGLPPAGTLAASALMSAVLVVLCPLAGTLSDRWGRKPLLLGSSIGMAVLAYPLFAFLRGSPDFVHLLAVEAVFAVLIAAFTAPAPALMAELVPTEVRNTTLALSYNFAVAIFGGFGPFIVEWLIQATGNVLAPGYYVIGAALISTVAVLMLEDRTGKPLA